MKHIIVSIFFICTWHTIIINMEIALLPLDIIKEIFLNSPDLSTMICWNSTCKTIHSSLSTEVENLLEYAHLQIKNNMAFIGILSKSKYDKLKHYFDTKDLHLSNQIKTLYERLQKLLSDSDPSLFLYRTQNKNNQSNIELLLTHSNIDPNQKDNIGWTPLTYALYKKNKEVITLLLGHPKIDPNQKDTPGWTPLQWAIYDKNKEAITLLLGHPKIDPNQKDNSGWTPLTYALYKKNKEVITLLLEHPKIDPNQKDNNGWTPLQWAIYDKNKEVITLLLGHPKIDSNQKDNIEATAKTYFPFLISIIIILCYCYRVLKLS